MKTIIKLIKSEIVLFIFVVLFVILAILYPHQIPHYPLYVDWRTIIALAGLLIITTGLKESGYFSSFAIKSLTKLKNEKELAIFFILISALLSTFLTNDITLFIIIPLTITFQDIMKNNVSKLIVFEAISVNVGSTLTPIGNPQNLYLWHKWDISFSAFTLKMLPLVILLLGILLIFAWISFPNKKIYFKDNINNRKPKERGLLILSVLMLISYIICLELSFSYIAFFFIFTLYFILHRKILIKSDWLLLFLFIIIFIDFHVVSTLPVVLDLVSTLNLHPSGNVFLFSILTSQSISNVPASVFLSKFSHNWQAISYGVNVGGNGLVWSSLANIIALRIWRRRKMWIDFHKYSVPYFLVTMGIIYVLFYVL